LKSDIRGLHVIEFFKLYSDQILMICSIAFAAALIPQVIYNHRYKICEIPYTTSVTNILFLLLMVVVYFSNGWSLAGVALTCTTLLWSAIALQRYLSAPILP
jgi:hypothetical protein